MKLQLFVGEGVMFPSFRRIALVLLILAGLSTPTVAGVSGFGVSSPEGVYKKRFPNGDVSGERYTSENVLKIVRSGPRAAFIWAELSFYNGHMCSIGGIAHIEGDALVYRETVEQMTPCVLKITTDRKAIHLSDKGSCKYMCGVRGSFEGETFSLKSRRPIRDLAGLKASDDYRDALAADWTAAGGQTRR